MMGPTNRVCVIGLGYIGLPTSALLANSGFHVHGVDVHSSIVETLNRGDIHIHEPDLHSFVQKAVKSGRFVASLAAIASDVFMIAVPTPFQGDHQPDLNYVKSAAEKIAPVIREGNLIILESTGPVGTTEMVKKWILARRPDLTDKPDSVHFAYCPERVLPGQILRELVENDRVVGGITSQATDLAESFYKQFVKGKVLTTNARTAEMCKLTENSFRDVNIAFANEISLICEKESIDPWELIRLANHHPRVNILQPGPGVGGHCIAVDPWFIVASAPKEARLIRTARIVNDSKPHHVVETVQKALNQQAKKTVACLGLAFKADIDDLRESPSVEIVLELAKDSSVTVLAVEPHVKSLPRQLQLPNVRLVDWQEALRESSVATLLVNHKQFADIPAAARTGKSIIDTRGFWSTQ